MVLCWLRNFSFTKNNIRGTNSKCSHTRGNCACLLIAGVCPAIDKGCWCISIRTLKFTVGCVFRKASLQLKSQLRKLQEPPSLKSNMAALWINTEAKVCATSTCRCVMLPSCTNFSSSCCYQLMLANVVTENRHAFPTCNLNVVKSKIWKVNGAQDASTLSVCAILKALF